VTIDYVRTMLNVKVYPLSNGAYASQVYAGLHDLSAEGVISLKYTARPLLKISERRWGSRYNGHIFYLELRLDEGAVCKVCYDFLDGPEIISLDGLEKCDVYFKRSFSAGYLSSRQETWQATNREYIDKILPYGLNYNCRSDNETHHWRRFFIYANATGLLHENPSHAFKQARKLGVKRLRSTFGKALTASSMDIPPSTPAKQQVLYQTRLFDPAGSNNYVSYIEAMNSTRIEIVRALRKGLGAQFVGGLIPNKYTEETCPELMTTLPTSRAEYFGMVRDSAITVFSTGLRFSTGFRLPEFLAMSRCIVSEHLQYELPTPLKHGRNCVYFDTPDGCVAACEQLLSNPAKVAEMRANNYEYYHQYVKPSAIVWNSLEAAISKCQVAREYKSGIILSERRRASQK